MLGSLSTLFVLIIRVIAFIINQRKYPDRGVPEDADRGPAVFHFSMQPPSTDKPPRPTPLDKRRYYLYQLMGSAQQVNQASDRY